LIYIGAAFAQAPSLQDLGPLVTPASEVRVYVVKEFIAMDPERPRAEAIAVRDGRFLAVGSLDEVTRTAGVGAAVDRSMAGNVVIAGFVEQHVHPVLAALTMNTKVISIEDWDAIDGFSAAVRDEGTYAAWLRKALAAHKDKTKPFLSWGYHHYFHGSMSRRLRNELAPDFPVII
jgi:predicted amidohydrolase YtcJ